MQFEIRAMRGRAFQTVLIEAGSQEIAVGQARSQGYSVVEVRPVSGNWFKNVIGKGRFPLVLFSQELLALCEAGLNLVEALEGLAEKETRPEVREVLSGVLRALNEGQPLSTSMEKYPDVFPPLYVATLRASEKTGNVSEALGRYIAYQSQVEQVRKKIVSASIYPAMLILVGGLVSLFLMGYVVPKFSHIYEDVGGKLPLLSRWLLAWGEFIELHGAAVLGVMTAGLLGVVYLLSLSEIRMRMLSLIWRIPALGERFRIYQLARFYRTLGMLLTGGTTILGALGMVSGLLSDSLRDKMAGAIEAIRQGRSISVAMEQYGLTTPVALRMLRVGERSGRMGEMMERIAVFYDDETARWIDLFTRMFEPLLMMVIGVVIGGVVLLLYMPIFELAGNIQ